MGGAQTLYGLIIQVPFISFYVHLCGQLHQAGQDTAVAGVEIAMVGRAPLGDPLEVELRGYRLSIRGKEAELVEIESAC